MNYLDFDYLEVLEEYHAMIIKKEKNTDKEYECKDKNCQYIKRHCNMDNDIDWKETYFGFSDHQNCILF